MNCPTCGKAQLTERPHHHEANMDNPPEEPGFDDEPSADWVAGYQAGLDTARAPSASEDVGLRFYAAMHDLFAGRDWQTRPHTDDECVVCREWRIALRSASPTPETPSLDVDARLAEADRNTGGTPT